MSMSLRGCPSSEDDVREFRVQIFDGLHRLAMAELVVSGASDGAGAAARAWPPPQGRLFLHLFLVLMRTGSTFQGLFGLRFCIFGMRSATLLSKPSFIDNNSSYQYCWQL
jgi:hypothetical protein